MENEVFNFETNIKPIKGFPELHWLGKHPYTSTQYYPAQLKESYGEEKEFVNNQGIKENWINKIFWGDNIQVMSHLLKEFRGKIDLIYIDPPFDSKADYKKKIKVKGKDIKNDLNTFEEKQYGDIWANDDYLQFMYERLILMRELLSDGGSIYLHCDNHLSHHIRCLMDEIFGVSNFRSSICWDTSIPYVAGVKWVNYNNWIYSQATIFYYVKNKEKFIFNRYYDEVVQPSGDISKKPIKDVWCDIKNFAGFLGCKNVHTGYPTQKPEELIKRIIEASSNLGDLVFDCFMGSGTTQAVAMKLGRRFIGADINLGAVQTTTKRLVNIKEEIENNKESKDNCFTGFEVYNVNNYDLFRNPVEAKDIILDALSVNKYDSGSIYDGELDGYKVKVMNVNRITSKADLELFRASLPFKTFEERKREKPNTPVEKIMIVCMGHEPDLEAAFKEENLNYILDIKICDILIDKKDLTFKRDSEADIEFNNNKLIIKNFYPLNLMQKLSMDKKEVENYKQLVDSILIDYNYDGLTLKPQITDIPEKNAFIKGEYEIPSNHGKIKIKITDLLSESFEMEVK